MSNNLTKLLTHNFFLIKLDNISSFIKNLDIIITRLILLIQWIIIMNISKYMN